MTEIFLDENLSEHVAAALNLLCKGYFPDVNVQSTKNAFGKGVTDEIIIPGIGKQKVSLLRRISKYPDVMRNMNYAKNISWVSFFFICQKE